MSDSGVIFSPPSIMREALDDSEFYLSYEDEKPTVPVQRQSVPKVNIVVILPPDFWCVLVSLILLEIIKRVIGQVGFRYRFNSGIFHRTEYLNLIDLQ